ncbi:glycosyltransferase [Paenibacillus polymyxa]|uniref:glycosyltransferase n=1 Tax=Paenibacillus polymyxa TaxID=1406 RepID=UPI002AB35458|nr:glycosyltransferase [Paenibacillus polymyxa]MDY7991540.1 glycosyltransferase [Paenibacillus polymyxa]
MYIPGIINTHFYKLEKKPVKLPLQIVFCADRAVRKDFPTLAQAFNMLDENFHLHIVGNWGEELNTLKNDNYTFHGTLNPLQLRQLYKKCNIFVSCSTQDTFAWDGFPTTAAAEAIATGCILVSTNSRNDERILEAGEDYFKIDEANPDMLVQTLNMIRNEFPLIQEKGYKTAIKTKNLLDAQGNVRKKLNIIF